MANPFERKYIGGLIFAPTKAQREIFKADGITLFPGIERWIEKKCPDKAVILDYAGAFVDLGIPILDATFMNGVYIRLDRIYPVGYAKIHPNSLIAKEITPFPNDLTVISEDGILMVTDEAFQKSTGHGKMSRGLASRKSKK